MDIVKFLCSMVQLIATASANGTMMLLMSETKLNLSPAATLNIWMHGWNKKDRHMTSMFLMGFSTLPMWEALHFSVITTSTRILLVPRWKSQINPHTQVPTLQMILSYAAFFYSACILVTCPPKGPLMEETIGHRNPLPKLKLSWTMGRHTGIPPSINWLVSSCLLASGLFRMVSIA
jgi:hypothetical protein